MVPTGCQINQYLDNFLVYLPTNNISNPPSFPDSTLSFDTPLTSTNFTYSGVTLEDASAEFKCVAVFEGQIHPSEAASITVLGKRLQSPPPYPHVH